MKPIVVKSGSKKILRAACYRCGRRFKVGELAFKTGHEYTRGKGLPKRNSQVVYRCQKCWDELQVDSSFTNAEIDEELKKLGYD